MQEKKWKVLIVDDEFRMPKINGVKLVCMTKLPLVFDMPANNCYI